ncbi:MAG: Hsp20/alpha crystallin family protein [Micromonosporaceae bacterium]
MTITPSRFRPARFALMRRGDPWREMEEVYDRMGRLMQDILGDGTMMFAAPADIEETDDAYIVDIEVPGVRREDVNVELRDRELHITGEIKDRERTGTFLRRERRTGRFEHVMTLPGDIDPQKVEANLSGGVLTVRVAKARPSQARRIEVKGS